MIKSVIKVFVNIRVHVVRFLRDTSDPMSPYLIEHLTKLAELEGPRVRIPR